MNIEEQVLSREQMKHLQELGVDTSDASMAWYRCDDGNTERWYLQINNEVLQSLAKIINGVNGCLVPAYTIGDLIEKLPEEIKYRGFMIIKRPKFTIWDICALKSDFDVEDFGGSTLKDALYDLLCWTIKNHKELIK